MEEKINISQPSNEWRDKVQIFAMDLIEKRFLIDEGNLDVIPSYKNMLRSGVRILCMEEDTEVKELLKKIKNVSGFVKQMNPLTGDVMEVKTDNFEEFMENLDELDKKVRLGLRDAGYLIRIVDKKVRLT